MKNVNSIISGHNHNILNAKQKLFGVIVERKTIVP